MLQQWIGEGRVLPHTMLEDEASGQRVAASAVPGLSFPQPAANPYAAPPSAGGVDAGYQSPNLGSPYAQNPYQSQNQPSNYYRPGSAPGARTSQDVTLAWVFSALQLVPILCCIPISIAGLVMALKAKREGQPNAQAPMVFSIVMMSLWLLWVLVQFLPLGLAAFSGNSRGY